MVLYMEQHSPDEAVSRELTASITSRDQVTVPAEVREFLGIEQGGKVVFVVQNGQVTLKKPRFTMKSVGGSVPPLGRDLEWHEMQEIAWEDAFYDEYAKDRASNLQERAPREHNGTRTDNGAGGDPQASWS